MTPRPPRPPGPWGQSRARSRSRAASAHLLEVFHALIEAVDWALDDPRLPGLADRLAGVVDRASEVGWDTRWDDAIGDDLVDLLDSIFVSRAPYAARLLELLEERGWRG